MPLIGLFDKLDDTAQTINFIGKTATIILPVRVGKIGQADLFVDDLHITLSVKGSSKVHNTINKDTKILLQSDNEISLQRFISILDKLKHHGIKSVQIDHSF